MNAQDIVRGGIPRDVDTGRSKQESARLNTGAARTVETQNREQERTPEQKKARASRLQRKGTAQIQAAYNVTRTRARQIWKLMRGRKAAINELRGADTVAERRAARTKRESYASAIRNLLKGKRRDVPEDNFSERTAEPSTIGTLIPFLPDSFSADDQTDSSVPVSANDGGMSPVILIGGALLAAGAIFYISRRMR